MKFKDEVRFRIRSGHGGPGCVSFRREIYVPRGGPDGGDGGKGGDVIFRVNRRLNTLIDLRPNKLYSAQNGQPGQGELCSGPGGKDLILEVPEGTVISSDGQQIADLSDREEVTVLKGGRGGKGNHFFKTSVNQTPTQFQPGEEGEEIEVTVELKLIADVGLLGFPNVGKSTFISTVSAAKPKVADYPFTTLTPHLGVVKVDEEASYVIADIPGLIPGASQGVGLGIEFLKHIERTRLFLHMVDPVSERDPIDDYQKLRHELAEYDKAKSPQPPMSERPEIIVINKADTLSESDASDLQIRFLKETQKNALIISTVTRIGMDDLMDRLAKIVFGPEES